MIHVFTHFLHDSPRDYEVETVFNDFRTGRRCSIHSSLQVRLFTSNHDDLDSTPLWFVLQMSHFNLYQPVHSLLDVQRYCVYSSVSRH